MTLLLVVIWGSPSIAQTPVARVADVTRLQGQGINVLMGYGLVTGLNQTGDNAQYLQTIKSLRSMMERFGANIDDLDELTKGRNAAVVMLEVIIPEHGAREGDLLDVSVTALAADSLEGGRLISAPLVYHDHNVDGLFGFAQGRIVADRDVPTTGRIRHGARMERDVFMNVVASGGELRATGLGSPWIHANKTYVTLVLDEEHAGWSMAVAIAQAVDKELSISADVERVALAVDSKNIVILLPKHQRSDPASWIRDIEQTPILMESNEARVTINRRAGTIVITGDTRISPVVVSQRGMTVTIATPGPGGIVPVLAFEQQKFVPLDSRANRSANVSDLLEALNRLQVSFEDRASILEEVHRAGKLHAQLRYEG